MKVFLDIGAHKGQTLIEVLNHRYAFDKIFAFEPMPKYYQMLLRNFSDERLEVFNFGLLDTSTNANLYGVNRRGDASIYANKTSGDARSVIECQFVEAAAFFKERLVADDINLVKINCEGSEIRIFDNLINSGEIWKISAATVAWDADKIPGMESAAETVRERLRSIGFHNHEHPPIRGRSHQMRIRRWLTGTDLPIFT